MRLPENIHALVSKYNRPGPRYTSYPTAPHFRDDIARDSLMDAVRTGSGPISLYLHIPFCEKNCWFCGCNTIITTRHSRADTYLDLIEQEIRIFNSRNGSRKSVGQMHWGGGTPNFLSPEQIQRLLGILREGFDFLPGFEFSVELAPSHLKQEQIDALIAGGLTRASFGIQDCQPEVQRAINRIQPMETNRWVMDALRKAGISSVNVDLIYGLPLQTPESYHDTLQQVLTLNPDRFAIFSYAHLPSLKPAQRKLEAFGLPDPDTKIRLLLEAIQTLTASGYDYIGMDHFAKPGDELNIARTAGRLHRNFQGYTVQEATELVSLGISSISETARTYRQNAKDWRTYADLVQKGEWPIARGIVLSDEDEARRWAIQSIMCRLRLDRNELVRRYPAHADGILNASTIKALAPMDDDGFLTISDNGLQVTDLGRLFLRNIAMTFDAWLDPQAHRHSSTV